MLRGHRMRGESHASADGSIDFAVDSEVRTPRPAPAMSALVLAAVSVLSVLPASALAQRGAARLDTTFAFVPNGSVDINVFAGDIAVTGWDRSEVRVLATSANGLRLDQSANRLSLDAGPGSGVRRDARVEVSVPRGASLTLVTHSGEVVARGIRGSLTGNVTNGDISVSDIGGTVTLTTVTGDIRGERLGASTKAVAVNGNVVLRGVDGDLTASTTNGEVALSGIRSRSVKAGSVNGTVEYGGAFDRAGSYTFEAHNGNITLLVPDGTGATLLLGTHSGHVESDIPLTLGGDGQLRNRQRYTFTLGGGGATIAAQSHTGNIFIRRASRANP